MRVTISQDDSSITVDGVTHAVDCSELPTFVRVIQWDDDRGRGHIELDPDERGVRMGNLPIPSLEPFQFLVERWRIAGTLKAREAAQARVDEVVEQIATHEQIQAQRVAQQVSTAQAQAEQQRLTKQADSERKMLASHDEELKKLQDRLTEAERQLAQMGEVQ